MDIRSLRNAIYSYLKDADLLFFETRVSHLLPQKSDGRACVFLYSEIRKNEYSEFSEPHALIELNINTGEILEYRQFNDGENSLEWKRYIPSRRDDFRNDVEELFDLFDGISNIFFKHASEIDDETRDKLRRLRVLYENTSPAEMMEYYYKFGKDFFDWLGE